MRRRIAILIAAAFAPAAPASAQIVNLDIVRGGIGALIDAVLALSSEATSDADIAQRGFAGRAFVAQTGSFNRARVDQDGIVVAGVDLPNVAVIGQTGATGRAEIAQVGAGHVAGVNQDATTALATALIAQEGSFNLAASVQAGIGGFSQVTQGGGLLGVGAHIALVRQRDGGVSTLSQQGSDHLALIDQAGFSNISDLSQRDIGSDAGDEIILTAGVFQTGDGNTSDLKQDADGAGAFASVIQSGDGHASRVEQKDAAETLLFQTGARNISEVTQANGSAGSLANVDQLGARGFSRVLQTSRTSTAIVLQQRDGDGAFSELVQDGGEDNFAMLVQGADARSTITQLGRLNHAMVTQTGAGSVSTVRQTGSGNRAEVRQ